MREEGLLAADVLFEPCLAPSREQAVPCQVRARDGLLDVVELAAGRIRAVEWNE
jgi:hypothetical protein